MNTPPSGEHDALFVPPPPVAHGERLRVAVLVSGSGTTLQNLINEQLHGTLPIEIRLVVSSRADAFALERARRHGIPTALVERTAYTSAHAFDRALELVLDAAAPDLICMAGFIPFWTIPQRWLGRVLNIHPSLLPAFGGKGMYGDRVHEAVLAYGCRVSGCTVHFADNRYDHGPVIVQRVVHVLEGDEVARLRARVFREECIAYPQAIRLIAEGRIRVEGRLVHLVAPPAPGARGRRSKSAEPPR